jgi:hypothetical protein
MTNFICYITVGLLFTSAIWSVVLASESCSRTAVINYQEVLIDSANSLKGEGLRPYLSKDTQALSYLEIYQQNARPSFKSSFLGTTGVALSLLSFTTNSEHKAPWNSKVLLTTGLSLIVINYIFNHTLQKTNEENLYKAIDEYNLKHRPKIEFTPEASNDNVLSNFSWQIGFTREF